MGRPVKAGLVASNQQEPAGTTVRPLTMAHTRHGRREKTRLLTERLTERVMVINTNISAQSSARMLAQSSRMLSKSLARLSSGSKITSPEDDVAGLAVSMKFDAQI